MKCIRCGAEIDEGASFCSFCGAPQTVPNPTVEPAIQNPESAELPPQPRRKKHVGLIIIACIAALLVIVAVTGICTNWFGFYGPATRIALAAGNTAGKGNFTIEMSTSTKIMKTSSYSVMSGDAYVQVDIDPENRKLLLYGKSEQKYLGQTLTIYIGIIDGNLITGSVLGSFQNYQKEDISDELDEFFDNYDDPKSIDWEELFEIIEENTEIDPNEYIDVEIFKKCILAYFRKLNNNSWLKENAGYSTFRENGMRYYKFQPDLYEFSRASLECFETAFQDTDDYDDVVDSLKDSKTPLSDKDTEILIGIEGNQLKELDLIFDADAMKIDCDMKFRDMGTTEIPEYLLEDLLLKAS